MNGPLITFATLFTGDDFIACFTLDPVPLMSELFMFFQVGQTWEAFAALTTNCKAEQTF